MKTQFMKRARQININCLSELHPHTNSGECGKIRMKRGDWKELRLFELSAVCKIGVGVQFGHAIYVHYIP